ncbi:type 2 lantibiotic biosynthesis protein LanM [Kutzneria viridogrisea]|uniref:Type 2 lantibiotic biosynthesis protein LanM n=1 Tax=Kutzneria viridogrisea TaxID=47990 RepID=A0ABR6BM38_9PSEU|nr:type 2 lantibiotic biosynthesis protein LanM [Kutzneria viridogrisea]
MESLVDVQSAPAGHEEVYSLEKAVRIAQEPVIPEVLAPVLEAARRDVIDILTLRGRQVVTGVVADSLDWFRQILARLTNLVVIQRFSSFHLIVEPLWRPPQAPPGDAGRGASRRVLDSYIAWERSEQLLSEQGPYPEMARLVQVARQNWLAAVVELVERVHEHRAAVAELAGCRAVALGPLTGAQFGISDPHDGGRTAAILSFSDRKVVYKPRSIDGEIGWTAAVTDIVGASLGLPVRQLRTAGFTGYGFMEYLAPAPCATAEAVHRCYLRYGALLALAHALGSCDLHHENVIVSGEHPVVIDAEPLLRARLAVSSQGQSRLAFEQNLSLEGLQARESVLELGMLPLTMRSPIPASGAEVAEEYEIGALCAYAMSPIRDLVPCARGSDDLQVRFVRLAAERFPNLPTLNGEPALPHDFVESIVAGFESTHRYLRGHRARHLGAGGLLAGLASSRLRLLARPTMDYATVLSRSLNPEPLRSFEARSQLISRDLRHLAAQRFDRVLALADHETASLLAGDIPRFEVGAGTAHLGQVPLLTTAEEGARARWAALDAFDQRLQVASIRERLLHRERDVADSVPRSTGTAALREHAYAVAALLAEAIRSPEADPHWVHVGYAAGFGATMVHADRESLYEGAAGTALLLAEAGRHAGEPDWVRLATGVFGPIVRGQTPASLRRSGGLGRGLGGLLYAMVRVADASGDQALLDAAGRLAVEHGPVLARQDELDEVLHGRAGMLLALLALHDRQPSTRLGAVLNLLAQELLARAVHDEHGTHWPVAGGHPMPNASHGAVGIAMALARWAALRGDEQAVTAVQGALRFDNTFWLAENQGWRDARLVEVEPDRRTSWAWCNGRSGALLARLAVADALGLPFLADRVPEALRAPAADVLAEVAPGLCCGTPGAVDALLRVEQEVVSSELSARVGDAVRLVATKAPQSHYSTLTASLFAGTAGLAFALLRAADPTRVDSVLWFG